MAGSAPGPAWIARVEKPLVAHESSGHRHRHPSPRQSRLEISPRTGPVPVLIRSIRVMMSTTAPSAVASTPELPASSRRYASSSCTPTSSCGSGRAMTSPTRTSPGRGRRAAAGRASLPGCCRPTGRRAAPASCEMPPACISSTASAAVASGPTVDERPRPARLEQVADGLRGRLGADAAGSRPASRRRRTCSGSCGRCRGRARPRRRSAESRRA